MAVAKRRKTARFQVKRVYDDPARGDGLRVLVDRVWPRGMSREAAKVDLWLREIAPSTTLRRWFAHDPDKWNEFRRRYGKELEDKQEEIDRLRQESRRRPVTLLFAARDTEHNNAVALKAYLESTRKT